MDIHFEGNIEKVCADLKRFKIACEKSGITLSEYAKSMMAIRLRRLCEKQLEAAFAAKEV